MIMTDVTMVTTIVKEIYNLPVAVTMEKKLESYDGLNFLVRTDLGESYVLKLIPSDDVLQEALSCQVDVMRFLHSKGFCSPKVMTAVNGRYLNKLNGTHLNGVTHPPAENGFFVVALLEYIPGSMLRSLHPVPYYLFHEAGRYLADLHELTKTYEGNVQPLKDFNSRSHWSLEQTEAVKDSLSVIKDEELSSIISEVTSQFEDEVIPVLSSLPCGITHGDYNDDNIIVRQENEKELLELSSANTAASSTGEAPFTISGIIDFGDMMYTCLVFDIAIALSFMIITDIPDIMETMEQFLKGYSSVRKLVKAEKDVLLLCLLTALAQNIVLALKDHSSNPSNGYLLESVEDYPGVLKKLYVLHKSGNKWPL